MKTNMLKTIIIASLSLSASLVLAGDTKELWDKNCASCHGKDGKGDTKMGKKAGVKDYTAAKFQTDYNEEKGAKAIKEGVKDNGKEVMKPFAEKLSEAEIKALAAFVRSFKK